MYSIHFRDAFWARCVTDGEPKSIWIVLHQLLDEGCLSNAARTTN